MPTAPYGAWTSGLSLEDATAGNVSLHSLRADGEALLWLEGRPGEGRTTLMRCGGEGRIEEITPAPFDVGSRVHEYGGGAYAAANGVILVSHRKTGALWVAAGDAPLRSVAEVEGCRFADFDLALNGALAFAVREDHRKPGEPRAAIVAIDLTGATPPERNEGKVLAQGADFYAAPRISPDGRKFAWLTWSHPDMPWDASKLWLAAIHCVDFPTLTLGVATQVAGMMREAVVQPAWSPAGVLHFCTDRSGWWNVYRYVKEGTRLCPIQAEIGGPHWTFGHRYYEFVSETTLMAACVRDGVTGPVLLRHGRVETLPYGPVGQAPVPLPDGVVAYLSTPAERPAAILRQSAREGTATLRGAGRAALPPRAVSVGRPTIYPLPSGHTGHAFWYPPVNPDFEGPLEEAPPLIVMCHGGPTGMAGNAYSAKVQWWTSRGFGVLDVNYGGSTGYGRRYRERLDGKWGVIDVEDCIAAARHMAEGGYVDPRRMAIRGGSAGGLTVLNALATSDQFRAGASHYGVTDLMLLAGDTHKFESRYLDGLIGPLPAAETRYRERSPVNRTGGWRAPVIFFQGLEDKVVPPSQARAMAEAIRARGLPAPLHEFEGEGHGFRRAETQREVLRLETLFYGEAFGVSPVV